MRLKVSMASKSMAVVCVAGWRMAYFGACIIGREINIIELLPVASNSHRCASRGASRIAAFRKGASHAALMTASAPLKCSIMRDGRLSPAPARVLRLRAIARAQKALFFCNLTAYVIYVVGASAKPKLCGHLRLYSLYWPISLAALPARRSHAYIEIFRRSS